GAASSSPRGGECLAPAALGRPRPCPGGSPRRAPRAPPRRCDVRAARDLEPPYPEAPGVKRFIQSAALATASLAIVLGLLEASVRLFVPESRWRYLDATGDWKLDDELGWVNRPDLDVSEETRFGLVRFR